MKDGQSFDNLRRLLDDEHQWPGYYEFRFIAPSETIDQVIDELNRVKGEREEISLKDSRTGKYVSVSLKKYISQTDEVIQIYQRIVKIKGVISL